MNVPTDTPSLATLSAIMQQPLAPTPPRRPSLISRILGKGV